MENKAYLKEKASKALKRAKKLENKHKQQGAKFVRIDGKTFALKK